MALGSNEVAFQHCILHAHSSRTHIHTRALAYTSCGWVFESILVQQHLRAIQIGNKPIPSAILKQNPTQTNQTLHKMSKHANKPKLGKHNHIRKETKQEHNAQPGKHTRKHRTVFVRPLTPNTPTRTQTHKHFMRVGYSTLI